MNRSAKGRRAEWRSRDYLASLGYVCVRAAGSKGVFDLVAFSPVDVVLIQVKSGQRGASPADIAAMAAFPAPSGCRRLVHHWRPRASNPEVREVSPA